MGWHSGMMESRPLRAFMLPANTVELTRGNRELDEISWRHCYCKARQ